MHCALCGKLVTWLDRFSRCRECSRLAFDCFSTEMLPHEDEAEDAALELTGAPV